MDDYADLHCAVCGLLIGLAQKSKMSALFVKYYMANYTTDGILGQNKIQLSSLEKKSYNVNKAKQKQITNNNAK